MIRLLNFILFLLPTLAMQDLQAETGSLPHKKTAHSSQAKTRTTKQKISNKVIGLEAKNITTYRGWDYLVKKLRADGFTENYLTVVYRDKRMPPHSFIPFSLKPKEPHSIYSHFTKPSTIQHAHNFISRHKKFFEQAELSFGVSRSIVAAIFLVETHAGLVTGKELILNRLSRLASIAEAKNVSQNFERLRATDTSVTLDQVQARANYLEETFYPEVTALLAMASRQKIDVLAMKGSSAGAIGIPQFLPSSLLKFGVDANKDGQISLFHEADAIWSTANYLSSYGWQNNSSIEAKRKVIWMYNHSEAYVDTVLYVAGVLEQDYK